MHLLPFLTGIEDKVGINHQAVGLLALIIHAVDSWFRGRSLNGNSCFRDDLCHAAGNPAVAAELALSMDVAGVVELYGGPKPALVYCNFLVGKNLPPLFPWLNGGMVNRLLGILVRPAKDTGV
ncbi:MAG: hypothetical protein Kow00107_03240 [Planctomycetota bacterium]